MLLWRPWPARLANGDRGAPVVALLRGELGRGDHAERGFVVGHCFRHHTQAAILRGAFGERCVDRGAERRRATRRHGRVGSLDELPIDGDGRALLPRGHTTFLFE
jgi:hypothetical protein